MNFKTQANKLEDLLKEEIKKIPLVILSDKLLAYKNYKIKQDKKGFWNLFDSRNDFVAQFRIKSTACLAAKFYDKVNLKKFNEIKILDLQFWNNNNDSVIFEYKYKTAKDFEKREIFKARLDIAKNRAKHYKEEISSMFKANF